MTNVESRKNRRQFLEESMLAAAAVAAAGPGELLWDELPASRSALEQLGVAVIGVRGRGNTHLGFFAGRRDTRVLYVCDVDHQVGVVARRASRQAAGRLRSGAGRRHASRIRRSACGHCQHRDAPSLARTGRHLGDAGGQRCLRREAGQSQRAGRPLPGAGRSAPPAHLPVGNAGALESGRDRSHGIRAWRGDRSRLSRACHLLQTALVDWTTAEFIPSRSTSTTTSGSGQPPPRR